MYKYLFIMLFLSLGGSTYIQASSRTAPDIEVLLLDGEKLRLSAWQGHPVLVYFWASTCAPCMQELPVLRSFYARYAADGLKMLGIAMFYDPPNRVYHFRDHQQLPWPLALDMSAEAAQAFGNVLATPAHILITADGYIYDRGTGLLDTDRLHHQLQLMMENQADSTKKDDMQ